MYPRNVDHLRKLLTVLFFCVIDIFNIKYKMFEQIQKLIKPMNHKYQNLNVFYIYIRERIYAEKICVCVLPLFGVYERHLLLPECLSVTSPVRDIKIASYARFICLRTPKGGCKAHKMRKFK